VVVAFCVALALLSIEADELFVAPALDCAFMSLACAGWLLVLDCGLAGSDGVFAAAAALLSWALVDASIFWVALVEASVCVALVVALVEASIFCVPFVLVDALVFAAALSLRQSLSAVPSFPEHAAGVVDGALAAGVDAAAALSVVPVV